MKSLTIWILSIVIILFFQGCMTYDKNKTGPGSLLLSQNELEQLFSRQKTFTADFQGKRVEVKCSPDGTQKLVSRDPEISFEDTGTYTIQNGKKCDVWQKSYEGREQCLRYNYVRSGRYYLVNPDGSFHAYITMQ